MGFLFSFLQVFYQMGAQKKLRQPMNIFSNIPRLELKVSVATNFEPVYVHIVFECPV